MDFDPSPPLVPASIDPASFTIHTPAERECECECRGGRTLMASQESTLAQETPSPAQETSTPALVCDSCGMAIVAKDELRMDRAQTMDSAVFAYELDVLDSEMWSYSATNPGAVRFDVVRTDAVPLIVTGAPTNEHSWFPPYLWRMAHCGCGAHLGWSFSSADADTTALFHGLIVTRLRERRVPAEQLRNREQLTAARRVTNRRVEAMVNHLLAEAARAAQVMAESNGDDGAADREVPEGADDDEGAGEGDEAAIGSASLFGLLASEAHAPAREAPALFIRPSGAEDAGSISALSATHSSALQSTATANSASDDES